MYRTDIIYDVQIRFDGMGYKIVTSIVSIGAIIITGNETI